jgi:AraC-like DNA-binding protein
MSQQTPGAAPPITARRLRTPGGARAGRGSRKSTLHHVEMSGPSAMSAQLWSTSAVAPMRAFEYWRDLLCDTFVQLSAAPTGPGIFAGQIEHASFADFEISTVRADGHRVRRTRQHIARAGEEYLLASVQTKGRCRVEQDGRYAELTPGAMALFDSTRPYTLNFDETVERVVVRVPLGGILAETGLHQATGLTATRLGGDGPAGVVAQFFHGLSRLHDSDAAAATALAAHGRGLMASALLLSDGRIPHDAAASLATVRGYLRMKHSDPDLTIDDVARACLVSRRTLYRLFESVPGGVGGLLRHIRVEHAQALLRADRSRPLTSVAAACGFAGERQFYRVFRQETGSTPGDYRACNTDGTPGQ